MAQLADFYTFLIAGAVLMLVPIFIIAYFQSGFFGAWLKARTGRGKYLLVKSRTLLKHKFLVGEIVGEWLIIGKKENTRRILLQDKNKANPIYRAWGVACVDMDEATNAILSADYSGVEGFDAEKIEGLHIRALYRPSLEENKDKLIFFLVILVVVLVLIGLFMNWSVMQSVKALGAGAVGTITTVV